MDVLISAVSFFIICCTIMFAHAYWTTIWGHEHKLKCELVRHYMAAHSEHCRDEFPHSGECYYEFDARVITEKEMCDILHAMAKGYTGQI